MVFGVLRVSEMATKASAGTGHGAQVRPLKLTSI